MGPPSVVSVTLAGVFETLVQLPGFVVVVSGFKSFALVHPPDEVCVSVSAAGAV
jgi:hypothetical protein